MSRVLVATFPFQYRTPVAVPSGLMPAIPITLRLNVSCTVNALLDTGASTNVIPHQLGLDLGGDWNFTPYTIPLGGALPHVRAKPLTVELIIATLPPVSQIVLWAENDSVPVILGQTNFFLEFDVCFFRARSLLEIRPRS